MPRDGKMLEYHLFMGLELEPRIEESLQKNSPSLLEFFIQDHPDYLKKMTFEGKSYLGKTVGKAVDLTQIELVEVNIFSLLHRLMPESSLQDSVLKIFPIIQSN